jgi:cellulose synthase/poly-beta-1,6-N-acetylglucosamine synthase-like glycosyltransferase
VVRIFYASFILIVYIYFGYPLILFLISRLFNHKIIKGAYEPKVTILISAYNERDHIKATIENKLALDYPKDKIEILVISDGSDDGTDEIVNAFSDEKVKLIRQDPRKGKTSALNLAVPQATGEILVFSDANSLYDQDSLRFLMENFTDPSVGYVTGKMVYVNPDGTTIGNGCSAYMTYENLLRDVEARIGSVVGVDGGIDAVRKSLYRPMRPDQLPDFVLPLMVVDQGYRVVFEPRALLKEESLSDPEDENRMRVRVSLRALWALFDMRKLLNPLKHGIFSIQLLSHKVLRYLGIVFIAVLYVSNLFILSRSLIFLLTFLIQNIMFILAFIAHYMEKKGKSSGILYIPYYFFLVNVAAGHALYKFLRGEKQVIWTPRKG